MRAIYREQGFRLYKIKGREMIEINLSSYEYGIIGLAYGKDSPIRPNKYAKVIRKAKFERYYKEALQKIKSV